MGSQNTLMRVMVLTIMLIFVQSLPYHLSSYEQNSGEQCMKTECKQEIIKCSLDHPKDQRENCNQIISICSKKIKDKKDYVTFSFCAGKFNNPRADDLVYCGYIHDCDAIDPFAGINQRLALD